MPSLYALLISPKEVLFSDLHKTWMEDGSWTEYTLLTFGVDPDPGTNPGMLLQDRVILKDGYAVLSGLKL